MTSAPDRDEPGVIDELLAGMGSEDAEPLRPVLEDLRSLAAAAPVLPNRRLAALLVDDTPVTAPLAVPPTALHGSAHGAPETVALPTSQAAADLLDGIRGLRADGGGEAMVGNRAAVVDLAAARSERADSERTAPGQRRRRRRPVATAMAIALAAGAATAAAAVAQSALFPAPDTGRPGIERPATSESGQAPSQAPAQPGSDVSPRLAPAEHAPQDPSPASTTGPTVAPSSTPRTSSPLSEGGAPAVPLPSLPIPSAPTAVPTTAPTAPDLLPLPHPSILPGGQLPLP
ncbi:hypothetical protein GCM10012320_05490 [Sinomonas cellulolyticus]|uniref:Anti-sigma-D factor RsdA sigma factor binding region domain-containing protein n=1 Tax=Sinomonas cellulolyticus TaxID=2801916 RepID=A0ABS1K2W7_9MICC|nr:MULTISPECIES: hypothetical protein [Sinomonas]MBL0705880.1 hypothetical protein [Sinomonas cellulolyticus]GHG42477.1 hypothetical protein GCM10012320_05490 [Sinomonas sp. KCTC 49339]